jgi:hypothetical protein
MFFATDYPPKGVRRHRPLLAYADHIGVRCRGTIGHSKTTMNKRDTSPPRRELATVAARKSAGRKTAKKLIPVETTEYVQVFFLDEGNDSPGSIDRCLFVLKPGDYTARELEIIQSWTRVDRKVEDFCSCVLFNVADLALSGTVMEQYAKNGWPTTVEQLQEHYLIAFKFRMIENRIFEEEFPGKCNLATIVLWKPAETPIIRLNGPSQTLVVDLTDQEVE